MPKNTLQIDCKNLEKALQDKGFNYLHVMVRSNHLIVYSQYEDEKENRARLSHIARGQYQLSMADHTGKWEPTPYTGDLDEMISLLTGEFGFALIDFNDFG